MSSPLNLVLVGAAFATIGGMVYGSYELLKNEDRPMNDLLELKKRVRLDNNSESDAPIWLQNWGEYIKIHTKIETEEVKVEGDTSPDSPKTKTVKKEVMDKSDVWGLLKEPEKVKKEEVPQGFKDKCAKESNKEHSGIWTTGYKNFEKYCTKPAPTDDLKYY